VNERRNTLTFLSRFFFEGMTVVAQRRALLGPTSPTFSARAPGRDFARIPTKWVPVLRVLCEGRDTEMLAHVG